MSDWIREAAAEAVARLTPQLRPRFPKKAWLEFSTRLEERGESLFRLLHRLYGTRFDFAWTLEEVIEVAAEGYLARPKPLRKKDRKAIEWLDDPDSLWGMAYLDRYARNASGLIDRIPHLQALGVTHLHLLPPYAVAEGPDDGGYAVADYRSLREGLGSMRSLRKSIERLGTEGVGVVLDLICNHTSSEHIWAREAAAGDEAYRDFYFMFEDRQIPDQLLLHLRSIFPDRGGDAFTWQPDVLGDGRWVWTTFYPFQWDLNYRNPRVLAAVAREMLFLANLGVAAIRMDATPFMWKEPGTSSENRPEAHLLLQVLRAVGDLACPSVQFLSEAIVHPDEVRQFVNPAECHLGYNPLLMTSLWDALATDDVRFLKVALGDRARLPTGCVWLSYLRTHDDIGWGFADEDAYHLGVDPRRHRQYLNDFYSGQFPRSFARGELFQENRLTGDARISGTLASLAGLEAAIEGIDREDIDLAVARILASWAVVMFAGGIPLIFLGDESAVLSDHSYRGEPDLADDNRWSHRPFFSEARFEKAEIGEGPEGAVLSGITRLLELRRSLGIPNSVSPEPFDIGDRGVIGFKRGPITVVTNLSRHPVVIEAVDQTFDVLRQEEWESSHLAPYEYRILT